MTTIFLQTERLLLRRFTATDSNHLVALDNDPQVMRFINGGTPTPRRVIEEEILPRFLTYLEEQPGYGFWAAEEQAAGAFVGWFSLRPAAEAGTATLGYRLRRSAWGKGYATEGVRALIDKAFLELDIRRIVATTYEENLASRRVMEKAGLRLLRRFRLTPEDLATADTFHSAAAELWDGDDLEYVLDKDEWQQHVPGTSKAPGTS
jgi:RimJ/RimL family protein N-acetyltransferase